MKLSLLLAVVVSLLAVGCGKKKSTPAPNNKFTKTETFLDEEAKKVIADTKKFNDANKAVNESYGVSLELPAFETNPELMEKNVKEALELATARVAAIADLKKDKLSFAETFGALEDAIFELNKTAIRMMFFRYVTPNKKIKDKASALSPVVENWINGLEANKNLFDVLFKYSKSLPAKALTGADKRLMEIWLGNFKGSGFDKTPEVQAQIKKLKDEINELKAQFNKNLDEANKNDSVVLTEEEVEGIPADELKALSYNKDDKTYTVLVGPFFQFRVPSEFSPKEEVRKKVFVARQNRGKEKNVAVTTQIVKKRAQIAKLLGFDSWADYKTSDRMAGNKDTALGFLKNLAEKLQPKFDGEVLELKKIKAKEKGLDPANPANAAAIAALEINAWDVRYYTRILKQEKYNVDSSQLTKYFEMERTASEMYKIYEEIFDIKIEKVKAPYVWDPKVFLLKVSDGSTGKPLGYLYMDLYPRPKTEKYGHFAFYGFLEGRTKNGVQQRPVGSLMCNFPEPKDGKPSLLTFDQVNTLYHEFGHALHHVLSETPYARLMDVPRDFVEAPSQTLEYWVTDPKVLARFAVNYQDPTDKLDIKVIESLQKAEQGTIALFYRRQLTFGIMDLSLYSEVDPDDADFDIVKFTNKFFERVSFAVPEETTFITSFSHLFNGYDAAYYGYAWADQLSADLASVFEEAPNGFLDKDAGLKLRREIYEVGNLRDVNESVRAFLGRETNSDAFMKKLGF